MQEGKITTNFLFASLAEFVSQFPAVWIGYSHTINRFCFGLSAGSVCFSIQSEILFEISYLIGGSISCEHQAVVVRLGNQQAQRIISATSPIQANYSLRLIALLLFFKFTVGCCQP